MSIYKKRSQLNHRDNTKINTGKIEEQQKKNVIFDLLQDHSSRGVN